MAPDEDVRITRASIVQRGLFIHRYTGIEYAFCTLIARAQRDPAYSSLGDVPFRFGGKVERMKALLEMGGL